MSRKLIPEHKPWPGKIYKFFVVDDSGHVLEGDLPSEEDAWIVIDFHEQQEGLKNLHIEVEHKPQVKKGFGRDPDLH